MRKAVFKNVETGKHYIREERFDGDTQFTPCYLKPGRTTEDYELAENEKHTPYVVTDVEERISANGIRYFAEV